MEMQQFYYDNKQRILFTLLFFWCSGMLVAYTSTMFLPNLTDGISWLSYGRLRPYILMPLFCLRKCFWNVLFLQRLLQGCTVTLSKFWDTIIW
jgi:hypothetical protein